MKHKVGIFGIEKGSTHVILPHRVHPKWIISLENKEIYRQSFAFYQPMRINGFLLKYLLQNAYHFLKFFNRNKITIQRISEFLPEDISSFSISLGTQGPTQKPTIALFKEGAIYAYAKVGHNDITKRLVKNEYETLMMLQKFNFSFDVPLVISYSETDTYNVLIQSTKENLIPIGTTLTDELVTIAREIKSLSKNMPFSHGDFAPWNIKKQQNGRYFIFDWELSGTFGADYSDAQYFVDQVDLLVKRKRKTTK